MSERYPSSSIYVELNITGNHRRKGDDQGGQKQRREQAIAYPFTKQDKPPGRRVDVDQEAFAALTILLVEHPPETAENRIPQSDSPLNGLQSPNGAESISDMHVCPHFGRLLCRQVVVR